MSVPKTPARPNGQPRRAHVEVRYLPVADLRPNPSNPRQHSPRQIAQIARSIETFGFVCPILIDEKHRIVCGHGRNSAALQLGITEVPTISLEHLSPDELKAFLLLDNRLAEHATWDRELLGTIFSELATVDLDFDLTITGFEVAEVDALILGDNAPIDEALDRLPTPGPEVTRRGDLWLLGEHRLLCGDALDPKSYETLLVQEKVALAAIDLPYNVPISGHVGGKGRIQHCEFLMAAGEMSETEFRRFISQACHYATQYSEPGALHYLWMDWRSSRILQEGADPHYSELKNVCVWVKDSPGLGSLYRSQHELIFVYKYGKGNHRNNIQLGRYGRNRSNVWTYPGANSFARNGEDGNLLAYHPTSKPTALIADILLDASAPRDLVLDSFAGAGSTLIAAERTGRRARTIEIEPTYVDTTIRRWQTLTKRSAVHAEFKMTFQEVAEMREEGRHE
jgi:DNA modification methylase